MRKKIKVLFLAYYFPPDASSGAFRPLFLSKHLAELGIGVTILTAREQDFLASQPLDYSLLDRIHQAVNVVRTRVRRPREALLSIKHRKTSGDVRSDSDSLQSRRTCFSNRPISQLYQQLKDTVTDLLATPDPQMGWIPIAVTVGASLIREKKIDVICATGSPWSAMIAGALLRLITGKPLLLDFRDPWVSNPGFVKRSALSQKIDALLEWIVIKQADALVANTQELRQNFLMRFPFLKRERVHVVFNGFETFLCNDSPRNKDFTMVHAGSLYFSRSPVPLLEALCELVDTGMIPLEKVQLVLIGECETHDPRLNGLLKNPSLQRVVKNLSWLPYDAALVHQMEADLLLLIQPDFPLQIPRKLFEYMALRRPVLAITEDDGATGRLVKAFRLGDVVTNESSSIQKAILERYRVWEASGTTLSSASLTSEFQNSIQAERFADIIFNIAGRRKRDRPSVG